MTPEELGKELSLCSISPRAYSYHDASFPVRADLNWSDSKRYRPKEGLQRYFVDDRKK